MRRSIMPAIAIALLLAATPGLRGQMRYSNTIDAGCGCEATTGVDDCCIQPCCPRILPAIAHGLHKVLNALLPCCDCNTCCDGCDDGCSQPVREMPCRPHPHYCRSICIPIIPIFSRRFHNDCCSQGLEELQPMQMTPTPAGQEQIEQDLPLEEPDSSAAPEEIAPKQAKPAAKQSRHQSSSWRNRTTSLQRRVSPRYSTNSMAQPTRYQNRTVSHYEPIPQRFTPVNAREINHSETEIRIVRKPQATATNGSIPHNPLR